MANGEDSLATGASASRTGPLVGVGVRVGLADGDRDAVAEGDPAVVVGGAAADEPDVQAPTTIAQAAAATHVRQRPRTDIAFEDTAPDRGVVAVGPAPVIGSRRRSPGRGP